MRLLAVASNLAFALGCGLIAAFFVPILRRASKIGYGFDLRWTMRLTFLFFALGLVTRIMLALNIALSPAEPIGEVFTAPAAVILGCLQAVAILGAVLSAMFEVLLPITQGDYADRDQEIAELARTLVRATRENQNGSGTNGESA